MAGRADYDGALHLGYDQGRAMSPEAAGAWREALARRLPPRRPLTVVDLGAGTGRFTDLIAAAAGGLVLGVEPAEKMRNTAVSAHPHPAGRYLAGRAEDRLWRQRGRWFAKNVAIVSRCRWSAVTSWVGLSGTANPCAAG